MALPCTAWTDFHSVLLLIYGKGQTGGSLMRRKKEKDNNTQKNGTKIWCGKVNYNRLVIVMLLKLSLFKPGKHCATQNWLHVKSELLQAEYALELTDFVAASSLFC